MGVRAVLRRGFQTHEPYRHDGAFQTAEVAMEVKGDAAGRRGAGTGDEVEVV